MISDHGTNHDPHAATAVDRRALVAELMSASSDSVEAEPASTVILLGRLCRAVAEYMSAAGVAVSLVSDAGSAGVVASSSELSSTLDELQFSLGEGPSRDTYSLRRPVLIADLGSSEGQSWPIYTAGALESGVHGVFAFPLHVGAATFGVFTIYRSSPGALNGRHLAMALTFAERATEILLTADSAPDGALHPGVESALSYRAEIYQAQGSVTVQLGISLAEALIRMRAYAFSHDHSLSELAALILSGEIVLESVTD